MPEDLDERLNGFWLGGRMGQLHRPPGEGVSPAQEADLGPADSRLRQAGEIIFEEFGGAPATPTPVELKDDLTVSLLQARLIELNLPINVKVGGLLRDSA